MGTKVVTWTCGNCGDTEEIHIYPDPCVIDAAWAEAEAAIRPGWYFEGVYRFGSGWRAATMRRDGLEAYREDAPTPAAALRALAAKLRA